ncbi:bifunctional (p)ppGpp synthetase/guanosine-3',5'-bis(diphosphate) 3'-pyrophosphohydrolase [Nitrosospira lacus]|uniref:GTP pyrophosphokinase n=1 Tax=Nitrosospira lacus TaxID=1288494 RepID=A0A1W6SKZ3_9PROT|nr:bifunctional (p)ppGpp synthetase/guanosine-3',5'-bis(diphosphate) 3'-pyrophosphohydrolase [Nitrosospira lacus]ARO86464.1 bifunctional (p)ppGpp synthetase/guanosine-3',5'-bis(diphosphate) 3'-pyrophosphohydrolase [Nitrosospira lacus]
MSDELPDSASIASPEHSSTVPSPAAGGRDGLSWLESTLPTLSILSPGDVDILRHALEFSQPLYSGKCLYTSEPVIQHVFGTGSVLASLRVDSDTLIAGLLHAVPGYLDGYTEKLQTTFGPAVTHLVEGVARMGRIRTLGAGGEGNSTDRSAQIEALRKMLLAMAEDIRVVIIALADRTQTMRYIAANSIPERGEIAHETLDIFAPLANRLGLWQIKWELEDLSFRILEPERYRKIARLLEDTRINREQYINRVVDKLQRELQQAGIKAEVTGRPKHIYSIHKKMKRKDVDFKEIHDARAVRILVNDVRDCYAALGMVHNLWVPIPKEFDDYIARPKGNDYRSLHTAVIGPEDKVVEIQIRTHEMHRHSEMGVAAHWRYKEGARRDARYEEKIAWLRQILEWKNDVDDAGELAEHFKTALFQDSVYVLTPQGRVISLPKGSTPVDFAYHVHTDLGHHCRGAKVDDLMVPLDYPLQNAQRVEIISAKQGGPSRDWLNPALGYLRSQRARSKVKQWFSALQREDSLTQGRTIVEKELQRHGMTALGLDKLAAGFKFVKLDAFLAAVARGDINSHQLGTFLSGKTEPAITTGSVGSVGTAATGPELLVSRKAAPQPDGGVLIVGVDKLLTALAKCCKPAPPDPIIGFVTRGRGITIHRKGCANLSRLTADGAERLVAADWDASARGASYPVDVEIEALDRQGLLSDISTILLREKINVTATHTQSRGVTAAMQFTLKITGLAQLRRVLGLIQNVPGVMSASRK